ncbi:hypothetical protein QCA50_010661 [Cerrena zonata]|uniref:Uncharacterized protein n=1 Tax=Cerrena zonata TaxID=2478898 RepID=A0AAW0G227_9APHY
MQTMPPLNCSPVQLKTLAVVSVATTVALASLIAYSRLKWVTPINTKRLRDMLPKSLPRWRRPSKNHNDEDTEAIWELLDPLLMQHGLEQWVYSGYSEINPPGDDERFPNGYVYIGPSRASNEGHVGTARSLLRVQYPNATFRIARLKNGHDVTVRPIKLRNEGVEHLNILKKVATGALALLSNNHALPMFDTIEFEDVTLGIFPFTGSCLQKAFGS